MDNFASRIGAIKAANLYRVLRTLSTPQGRDVVIDGQRVLLFSSNSYLGLNTNVHICREGIRAIEEFGVGSGGSRLVTGNMTPHMRLEAAVARFKGSEAALAFTSGYTANVGVISALCHKDTVIFSDALNHASIIDGCRLARGLTAVYAHNDMDDLLKKVRHFRPRQGFIVTDSVFSMDGDIARLPDLVAMAREHGRIAGVGDYAGAAGGADRLRFTRSSSGSVAWTLFLFDLPLALAADLPRRRRIEVRPPPRRALRGRLPGLRSRVQEARRQAQTLQGVHGKLRRVRQGLPGDGRLTMPSAAGAQEGFGKKPT